MLVLSRKVGESIQLYMKDGRIVDVTVTDIRGPMGSRPVCRLGITAPDDVVILRSEVPMDGSVQVFTNEATK